MTTIVDKIRAAIAAKSPDTPAHEADFIATAVCQAMADILVLNIDDLPRCYIHASTLYEIAAELRGSSSDERPKPTTINIPTIDDRGDAADAARFRWMLNGNGYFLEECGLCGHGPEDEDEAIKAIYQHMTTIRQERSMIDPRITKIETTYGSEPSKPAENLIKTFAAEQVASITAPARLIVSGSFEHGGRTYTYKAQAVADGEQPGAVPEPTDTELLDLFYGVNEPGMTGIEVEQLRVVWRAGRESVVRPIPTAERLPTKNDCNDDNRCWAYGYEIPNGETPAIKTWILTYQSWIARWPNLYTHWLPHWAFPLPGH